MKRDVTIVVPAYRAQATICDLLSSVQIQSFRDKCEIIIANDVPEENGSYEFVKDRFPDLSITILDCEKNGGPGIARQRGFDEVKTDWVTFIDADDIFLSPFAIENLLNNITPNCIEVQGPFYQEVAEGNKTAAERSQIMQSKGQIPPRMMPRNDVGHPWMFGRLYRVKFIRDTGISFTGLRAMEDGQWNWEVRMSIEGTPLQINRIEDPIYLWRTGSEHSITRIGVEENDGTPLYNWDLCQVGATAASINAIKFCKKKNPFNGGITRFCVEMMVGQYFTYIKCLDKKPIFAKQNLYNAKRFYNECYKEIESQIPDKILKDMYTMQYAGMGQEMVGIIPEITFFDFMEKLKTEPYGSREEFELIRAELPDWVKELDMKSGVLGAEGYIKLDDEE